MAMFASEEHLAVYIHIPFCKRICSYCDFCKVLYNQKWASKYLEQLENEIKDNYMGEPIKSIYIGGGTPSSLSIAELKKLFQIIKIFNTTDDFEFTMECNLNDINKDFLTLLKEFGVNRLSIGIQSFAEQNLKFLNRSHSFATAKANVALCRNMGFNNINIDLMYAIPKQTIESLKNDIKKVLKLKPEHISTYSLIIEDNTYIKYRNISPISEELDYAMYNLIRRILKLKGYKHYEISNFAKKGFFSKHNLTYWNNEKYYGFGLGASGYLENVRYENFKNLTEYLKGNLKKEQTILSKKDIMDNEIMLGLRKLKGLNVKEFNKKYNVKIFEEYPIKPLLDNKDLIYKNAHIFINPRKLYIMNELLLKII